MGEVRAGDHGGESVPETSYARNDEVHIAYQMSGAADSALLGLPCAGTGAHRGTAQWSPPAPSWGTPATRCAPKTQLARNWPNGKTPSRANGPKQLGLHRAGEPRLKARRRPATLLHEHVEETGIV